MYDAYKQGGKQDHPAENQGIKGAARLGRHQKGHAEHAGQGHQPGKQPIKGASPAEIIAGSCRGGHGRNHRGAIGRHHNGDQIVEHRGQGHREEGGQIVGPHQLRPGNGQAVVQVHRPAVVHVGSLAQAHHRGGGYPKGGHCQKREAGIQPAGTKQGAAHQLGVMAVIPGLQGGDKERERQAEESHRKHQQHHSPVFFHVTPEQMLEPRIIAGCCCSHSPQPPFLQ